MPRTTIMLITVATAGSALLLAGLERSPAAEIAEHPSNFPQGCVDCHVAHEGDEGPDMRLDSLLKDIGHRSIANRVESVPTDCLDCHEDDEEPTFAQTIHKTHFGKPDENMFVTTFGGDCRHCHQPNAETGDVTLKAGPKNW